MDLIIAFCARHWKIVLVVTVIASLTGLLWLKDIQLERARAKVATLEEKVEMLEAEKRVAIEIAERTKREYDEARRLADEQYQAVVEQSKNAVANYRKKFGSVPACSGVFNGVRLPAADAAGAGTNEGAKVSDGVPVAEPLPAPTVEFVETCSKDAGLIEAWKQLCRDSRCEITEN